MTTYLLALLAGIVVGLRTLTPPAMVAWVAHFGWLNLAGSWLAFLGSISARTVFTLLALVEYVTDQLPSTASRTVPVQFGARLVSAAFCGAAIATGKQASAIVGALAGALGAVIGTLRGHAVRAKLASAFGRDRPAAFIEDAFAILAAALIALALRQRLRQVEPPKTPKEEENKITTKARRTRRSEKKESKKGI